MQTTTLTHQGVQHLGRLITLLRQSSKSWEDCADSLSPPSMCGVFQGFARERTVQANTLASMLGDDWPEHVERFAEGEAGEMWRPVRAALAEGAHPGRVVALAEQAERQMRAVFLQVLRHVSAVEFSGVLWRFYATIKGDIERIQLWSRHHAAGAEGEERT